MPEAWNALLSEPDGLLCDLLADKVKGEVGVTPRLSDVEEFLRRLPSALPLSTPAVRPPTRRWERPAGREPRLGVETAGFASGERLFNSRHHGDWSGAWAWRRLPGCRLRLDAYAAGRLSRIVERRDDWLSGDDNESLGHQIELPADSETRGRKNLERARQVQEGPVRGPVACMYRMEQTAPSPQCPEIGGMGRVVDRRCRGCRGEGSFAERGQPTFRPLRITLAATPGLSAPNSWCEEPDRLIAVSPVRLLPACRRRLPRPYSIGRTVSVSLGIAYLK